MKSSRVIGMLVVAGMLGLVAFQGQVGGPAEAQARAGGYGAPAAPAGGGYGAPPAVKKDEEKQAPAAGGYGAPPPRPGGGYGAPPPRPGGGYGR